MKRLRLLLLVILMCVSAGGVSAASDKNVQVTQVDNSHYPDVTIYVSVTDTGGKVIGGLQQSDFTITEDNAPVQITGFKGGDQVALATMLVIDRSGSMNEENKLAGAQRAAVTFVDLMRNQDQAALVSFSGSTRVDQPFTSDKAALKRAINALSANDGTAWYDAVYEAAGQFNSVSGRRVIILLSDGLDGDSSQSLNTAITAARTAGTPVYAIGLGADGNYDAASLKRVAQETDGQFYHAPTAAELKALYESLAVGMQHDYAITYRSPRDSFDGTRRNISVKVGEATGGSQYLETHLLNIRSNVAVLPLLLLILPLLIALIAPLALTKRRTVTTNPPPTPVQTYAPPPHPTAPVWTPPVAPQPAPPQPVTHMPAQFVQSVEPRPTAVTTTCLKCGAVVRPDARFCAKCGTPRTPTSVVQSAPTACPQCGKSLKPGVKFCNSCGAKLST